MKATSSQINRAILDDKIRRIMIYVAFVEDYVEITKLEMSTLIIHHRNRNWELTTMGDTVYVEG